MSEDYDLGFRSPACRFGLARVVEELAVIAFSDIGEFADSNGDNVTLKDSKTLPRDVRRCVSEVSTRATKYGKSMHFKLHDKIAALKQLGEHLGMFGAKGTDGEEFGEIGRLSDEELEPYRKRLKLLT